MDFSASRTGLFLFTLALLFEAGCATLHPNRSQKPPAGKKVVALIDDNPVMLSEFEQRYARTLGSWEAAAADSVAAYKDFLERYVNFRMKVRAAKEAGYENNPDVQKEIDEYQKNFARPYLMEKKVTRPLARDLYEKKQEQVDVSHILIKVSKNASPQDTLKAYRKMQMIVDSLHQGVDFGDLAFRHSDDPSATRKPGATGYRGHLGYLPAGRIVKPFEDEAYSTPIGEVSPIIRTQFGYHIIKVHDRRPAPPKIRVAHIMIRPSRPGEDSTSISAKQKIHQLQDSLASGVPFAALARRHSDDPRSARRGGDLKAYFDQRARLPKSFKDAAFALDDVGDVSDVVHTRAGYHLIKLLERKKEQSFEEAYPHLKKRLKKLPRMKRAEHKIAEGVRLQHNVSVDSALAQRALGDTTASRMYERLLSSNYLADVSPTAVVAQLDDSEYTLADVNRFAKEQAASQRQHDVYKLIDRFLNAKAITYATHQLEKRDEQFGALMQQFRDGVLLFQLMEDSVWTKSQQDTSALRAYYDEHRSRYRFPKRIQAISFISRSDSALSAAAAQLDDGRNPEALIHDIQADSTGPFVRVDTMMVTDSTDISPYPKVRSLDQGQHLKVQSYGKGRSILVVHSGKLEPRPMRFEEAVPEIANDYQEVLNKELVRRLRRRYTVYTYPDHLSRAFQGPKPDHFDEASPSTALQVH